MTNDFNIPRLIEPNALYLIHGYVQLTLSKSIMLREVTDGKVVEGGEILLVPMDAMVTKDIKTSEICDIVVLGWFMSISDQARSRHFSPCRQELNTNGF